MVRLKFWAPRARKDAFRKGKQDHRVVLPIWVYVNDVNTILFGYFLVGLPDAWKFNNCFYCYHLQTSIKLLKWNVIN